MPDKDQLEEYTLYVPGIWGTRGSVCLHLHIVFISDDEFATIIESKTKVEITINQ